MRRRFCVALCLLLFMMMLPLGTASAIGEAEYLHEQKFTSDHQLTGLFSSLEEGFQVGQWKLNHATLTLCFSVTPLLDAQASDYTISLNGQHFYSGRIPLTQGQIIQTEIKLPVDAIKEGYNVLRIETYIRTNEQDPCRDDVSTASWMTVLSDSSIAIAYTPTVQCETVSDFCSQFVSIDALENKQSVVCVPQNADDVDLTAAALVLSGMSNHAVLSAGNIALAQTSVPEQFKYALYVARYDALPKELSALLSQEQQVMIKDGYCVMTLKKLAEGRSVLLVTGNSEALIKGGQALSNAAYMEQVKSEWLRIGSDEDVLMRHESIETTSPLTKTGSYVKGPFRQTASFYIDNPANRQLSAGSELDLAFRYSENLDFNRSMVTAYLDDTPIGSKKLTEKGAQGDTATFSLPENLKITGPFTLKITFDLEIPDMNCTERRDEMPWAFITSESMITLYGEDSPYLLFENYPSPFLYDGRFNNLALILPDNPSEADLEVLRSTLITLGSFLTDNTGSVQVKFNSNIGDLSRANIIDIGRLDKNPIAQQLNNQLYFQFSPQGTTIRSNEKMAIEPNYGATIGSAQLLYSPYSAEKHGLLLISGITDDAMLKAAAYIGTVDNLWEIYGDGFVADSDSSHSFRFKEDNAKAKTFFEKLRGRADLIVLLAVGTFMIVTLLVVLILVHRTNKRKKHHEQKK